MVRYRKYASSRTRATPLCGKSKKKCCHIPSKHVSPSRSFSTKEAATHAIVGVHNTEINAQPVKCSWGKESGDPNNSQTMASQALNSAAAAAAGYPYGVSAAAAAAAAYGQQLAATGCWYSPTPTYPASSATAAAVTPAAAASAAAVQNQFLQGIQGYHFGQYGGYQQGYMG